MLNTRLHPRLWQVFFEDLSDAFRRADDPRYALLRVSGPDLTSSRDVTSWLAFERISYDPQTATLHLQLDGFQHAMRNVATIWAAVEADGNIERIVALSRDGSRDYIEFSRYHVPEDSAYGRSRLEYPGPRHAPFAGVPADGRSSRLAG